VKRKLDAYLDSIGEELDRIIDLASTDPMVRVGPRPTRPIAEVIEDLIEEIGRWEVALASREAISVDDELASAPGELGEAGDRFIDGLRNAVDTEPEGDLDSDDDEIDDLRAIARIAALTCAVKRSDVERALGRPGRIETELAVDGVDERLDRACGLITAWEGSICLIALDTPAAWVVEGRRGSCTWRRGRGPALAAVVGHASDLLLYTWGRHEAADLRVTGDVGVVGEWSQTCTQGPGGP
jgi:hypothetical protein